MFEVHTASYTSDIVRGLREARITFSMGCTFKKKKNKRSDNDIKKVLHMKNRAEGKKYFSDFGLN